MPTDELEPPVSSAFLSILRAAPSSELEVDFDDFVSGILVRSAPADEESGPVVGVRLFTRGGAWTALLVLAPAAAVELAGRLARAAVESMGG